MVSVHCPTDESFAGAILAAILTLVLITTVFNSPSARCTCVSEFLPRDALVHSAVLRLHVVRLSVRLSVCDVGGSGSHRLEIWEPNCTIN